MGENGPLPYDSRKDRPSKPTSTLPWKFWIIEQYLDMYSLDRITFWEDRPEHAKEFLALNEVVEPEVIINYVHNGEKQTHID